MRLRIRNTLDVLKVGEDASARYFRLPAQDIARADIPEQHPDGVQDEEC